MITMHRIFFIGLLAAGIVVSGVAPASVERITEQLQNLNTRIDEIRAAPVIQSHDATEVEEYFLDMIKQNPSIQVMARIDTDGTLLTRVNRRGASRQVVNVAKEHWFSNLCKTKQPFNGVLADGTGRILLVHAWPIIETADSIGRLTGVFSVKVDIKKYLSAMQDQQNKGDPIMVLFRGTPLFSRNWNSKKRYDEVPVKLSGPEGDEFTVCFEKDVSQSAPQVSGSETENTRSFPGGAADGKKDPAQKPPPGAPGYQKSASPEEPVSLIAELVPKPESGPVHDSGLFMMIGLSAGIAVALVVFVMVFLIRRNHRERLDGEMFSTMRRQEPFEAILLDDEAAAISGEHPFITEAHTLDECISVERETKELPVLQELITESSKKLHEGDRAADPAARSMLFNKIHDDLNVWIKSEFRHLSLRLNQVSETIKECENQDGCSAELRELRYEIGKILEEMAQLEKRLPQESMASKARC